LPFAEIPENQSNRPRFGHFFCHECQKFGPIWPSQRRLRLIPTRFGAPVELGSRRPNKWPRQR